MARQLVLPESTSSISVDPVVGSEVLLVNSQLPITVSPIFREDVILSGQSPRSWCYNPSGQVIVCYGK